MAPPKKVSLQDLERWHSVQSAREELGLSRQGVRNLLERGDLNGVKTRVGWLIDPASVRAFALLQKDEERERAIRRARHATQGANGP
ncbi:MAG: helix-turn-helix domain-containing protein [Actinomycetota bacterium]|nr:helix-turn-helix domain-containing protein [Actinomycetota bacterium]